MMDRPQKITFAEKREMGVRSVVVDCQDYKCSHSRSGSRHADIERDGDRSA